MVTFFDPTMLGEKSEVLQLTSQKRNSEKTTQREYLRVVMFFEPTMLGEKSEGLQLTSQKRTI